MRSLISAVRREGGCALAHFALTGAVAAVMAVLAVSTPVKADSKDGIFPSADQVGGEVFPAGLKPGDAFPVDIGVYDEDAKKVDFGSVIKGKKTLVTFFISAAPASVAELGKINAIAEKTKGTQVVFLNADTVGVALMGGPGAAIAETGRTLSVIKRESKINTPMFVAPNDALDPKGLSNRLGFRGLPTSYLVSADGKVEKVFVGQHAWQPGDI
jgi:hypothetical protein